MALLETEFLTAIGDLETQWQKSLCEGDKHHEHGDWEDVRVLERYGTRYMRITRRITTSSVAKEESDDVRASEDEVAAADDDDSEALTAPVTDHERMRVVQCEIAYSPAYQVPVLYLTFAERSTDKSIALPSPDEVYNALVPEDFKSAMRSVGIMGALSMAEHPVTGVPAYFVHPCRTQEALSLMLDNDNSDIDQCNGAKYLLLWFGVIGASVGLNVPIGVAKLFADQSGDAVGELGKC